MVNFHENFYSRKGGAEGQTHIPALPFWVAIIRIVQLVFAFLVLCLTAFAASVFGSTFFSGYPMSWFTFIWTVGFLAYIFATPIYAPQGYLYWIHLGLEILTTIFWLTTFALLAQESQAWNAAQDAITDFDGLAASSGYDVPVWAKGESAIKASKAATAFGAFTWILFVVTLVVFVMSIQKHRVANGESGLGFNSRTAGGDVETAQKANTRVGQQEVYQQEQQPQVYQQVPVEYPIN